MYRSAFYEFHVGFPDRHGSWLPARDRASRPKVSPGRRDRILARDGRCLRCGATTELEVDHIVPVAHGGSNADENLQTLCRRCNREKSHHLEAATGA